MTRESGPIEVPAIAVDKGITRGFGSLKVFLSALHANFKARLRLVTWGVFDESTHRKLATETRSRISS